MKRITMAVLIGLLAGCQTDLDDVLSNEALQRDDDRRMCAAEGHHPGTEWFGFCVLEQQMWRNYRRSPSHEEFMRSPPPTPRNRPR